MIRALPSPAPPTATDLFCPTYRSRTVARKNLPSMFTSYRFQTGRHLSRAPSRSFTAYHLSAHALVSSASLTHANSSLTLLIHTYIYISTCIPSSRNRCRRLLLLLLRRLTLLLESKIEMVLPSAGSTQKGTAIGRRDDHFSTETSYILSSLSLLSCMASWTSSTIFVVLAHLFAHAQCSSFSSSSHTRTRTCSRLIIVVACYLCSR